MDIDAFHCLFEDVRPGAEYMVRARVFRRECDIGGPDHIWDAGDHVRMAIGPRKGPCAGLLWVPRQAIFPLVLGVAAIATPS